MKKFLLMLVLTVFAVSCGSSSKEDSSITMEKAVELAKTYIDNANMAMIYKGLVRAGTELCSEADPPKSVKSPDFSTWMIMVVPQSSHADYFYDLVFVNSEGGAITVMRNILPDLKFRKVSDVQRLK